MAHIIAVAGPIGSGKSTLARGIASTLGDASVLYFDSHERASRRTPSDMIRWMREGADFNAFALPELVNDLAKLKNGVSVTDPLSGEPIAAARHIVFEMPLGREHRPTAPYIDLLVWIDVPLDMALARKTREYTELLLAEGKGKDGLEWLRGYLYNYLTMIRPLMEIQVERVRPGADIIIDGHEEAQNQARRAVEEIRNRLSPPGDK